MTVSVDVLKDVFSYDPETGRLFWAKTLSRRVKVGDEAGGLDRKGYRRLKVKSVFIQAHRVIWAMHYGYWPPYVVDHVNGVKGDNRISNLRCATPSQNQQNAGRKSANTSGFKGVHWHRAAKKWEAQISVCGKRHFLGVHDTAEAAYDAYKAAAKRLHGEFANFG